ncbi:MAG TPA: hypothetical protein VJH03_13015 [Blastocatellia bacterium]|nr:hypothetical protein [Blastocatellia bacterium]
MIFGKRDVTPKDEPRRRGAGPNRVHSIAGVMKGRGFTGSFQVGGVLYKFAYQPATAEVREGKLHLRGRFSVTSARSRLRSVGDVSAVLIAAQGGIGTAPPRPAIIPAARAVAAPQPELEARASNSDVNATGAAAMRAQTSALPDIDGTGALSFCGAMYFRLDPLNGRALGVAADLSRVQFNARLLATTDGERALHGVYSALVDALLRDKADARAAELVIQLKKHLG